jgi:hypothetical protein
MNRRHWLGTTIALLAAATAARTVFAQAPAASGAEAGLDLLKGRWVRPDGGYVITIRDVATDGKLNASYANPNPLPFARAEAARDGDTIKLFFELRAGGYDGSTYTLSYDPKFDVLKGVYYQAVAKQKFGVYFAREK